MEAIARGNNLRGSARKARLVLDLIRGRKVSDAKQILIFSNKGVALKVGKILDSAIANLTEQEGKADLEKYVVAKAFADDGPIMRRFMPRSHGRATVIRKRTCHITLALSPASSDLIEKSTRRSKKITAPDVQTTSVPKPNLRTSKIIGKKASSVTMKEKE